MFGGIIDIIILLVGISLLVLVGRVGSDLARVVFTLAMLICIPLLLFLGIGSFGEIYPGIIKGEVSQRVPLPFMLLLSTTSLFGLIAIGVVFAGFMLNKKVLITRVGFLLTGLFLAEGVDLIIMTQQGCSGGGDCDTAFITLFPAYFLLYMSAFVGIFMWNLRKFWLIENKD